MTDDQFKKLWAEAVKDAAKHRYLLNLMLPYATHAPKCNEHGPWPGCTCGYDEAIKQVLG